MFPRRSIAGVVCLLLTIGTGRVGANDTVESSDHFDLAGLAKFRFGDDSKWAQPSFDDSAWDEFRVPESWLEKIDPYCLRTAGWYRLRVQLPKDAHRWAEPAICVGILSDAAEVFFNGVKIGRQGTMLPACDGLPQDPLVMGVPRDLIQTDEVNIVAVRVHRTLLAGGIVDGPLLIGDRSSVEQIVGPIRLRAWYFDGVVVCFVAVASGYAVLLFVAGVREAVYQWLLVCTLLLLLGALCESRFVFAAIGPSGLRRAVEVWSISLLPLCTHMFLAAFYGLCVSRRVWVVQSVIVLLLLVIGPIPRAFPIVILVWTAYQLTLFAIWLFWAIRAVKSRTLDAWPLLVGLVGVFLVVVGELTGSEFAGRLAGQYASSLGLVFFYACGMVAMTQRFQRSRLRAQQATTAILTAHEQERKRIARELHDGVVQSLLAIQLNLQMIRGSHQDDEPLDAESLDRVVEEIRIAGDELRRVSHDLRPEALERQELADAIRSHAKQLEQRVDFQIKVDAAELAISSHLKDNLYRIYQETLLNAVKHADATTIQVTLRQLGNRIMMTIQDDGRGFDSEAAGVGRIGVGLTTIRERAELLGGEAQVISKSNGTTIKVSVPLGGDV